MCWCEGWVWCAGGMDGWVGVSVLVTWVGECAGGMVSGVMCESLINLSQLIKLNSSIY